MLIYEGNLHKKIEAISKLGRENHENQTDRHTDR